VGSVAETTNGDYCLLE